MTNARARGFAPALLAALATMLAACVHQTAGLAPAQWREIHEVDYHVDQTRVVFAGDVMLSHAHYRGLTRELPLLRPDRSVVLAVPPSAGAMLATDDRLRVVGTLDIDGQPLRAALVPRGAMAGFALLITGDGRIDGRLAVFDYGWSERRRLLPVRAFAVQAAPSSARLLPVHEVESWDADAPFERFDLRFLGAVDGRVRVAVRRYASPMDGEALSERIVAGTRGGALLRAGGIEIALLEVESRRLKYRVTQVQPAPPGAPGDVLAHHD